MRRKLIVFLLLLSLIISPLSSLSMPVEAASTDLTITGIGVKNDVVIMGEVGLTGELRSVSFVDQRISEIARLGFKKCILPARTKGKYKNPKELTIVEANNIREALLLVFGKQ